jgi:predicted MFS family arabinose efflux permease
MATGPTDSESQLLRDDAQSSSRGYGTTQEDRPVLAVPEVEAWRPPPAFIAIELAIMTNAFLYGFDSTITASTYAVISSEFDAANTASWLTTSYLVTSTAFQPLYGRVSDIFGRRLCFFISTVTFAAGCLGCGLATNVVLLNCMRALTGFGGGGLVTMGEFTCPNCHSHSAWEGEG